MTRWNHLFAYVLLLTTTLAGAQAHDSATTPVRHTDTPLPQDAHLKLVVILSRHGVRSPTWNQDRLDAYSAAPWPRWSVPPGDLTERGYTLIEQFGTFDRAAFSKVGLFSANGCADASQSYLWADTDQRTVATGKALAEGLFPGCPPAVHSLTEGASDPLFHPAAHGVKPAQADAALAEFAKRARQQVTPDDLLAELNHILLGCSPKGACAAPARIPETALLGTPAAPMRGKSDHIVDLRGPLPTASTLSEDLLLEYADGMPMEHVGWGNVGEPELRRLLALHTDYFDLIHKTPALARLEASNLLFHIVRTLQQGVEGRPLDGAIGPAGTRLVMLAGHDTNLAGVSALLGLHWTLDGRADDTPPGTELAFELWQDKDGSYAVRVTAAMQTLRQLREMTALTPAAPPAKATLSIPGCAATCSWQEFNTAANRAIDLQAVFPFHSDSSQSR